MVGLLVAIGFILAALGSWAAGWGSGGAIWLPLHLALAGGAGTAVAAVLPFFTSALTVARPVAPWIRALAIGLVALGAVSATLAVANGAPTIGHIGGSVYLLGIAAVAIAAFRPLRGALGPRRRPIERAYAVALVNVAVSVTVATAFLAGWTPIVDRWAALKPAHGWLNVVGFVSLIIVATLVHLAPTVEGSRIRPRRSATLALTALSVGVPGIALGYATAMDVIVWLGAFVVLVGAIAVAAHALAVARDRGRWTTDRHWHRMTTWSLRAASGWLAVGILVAAGRILWFGADPQGWSISVIAAPLAIGWVVQSLVGAMTHLLPAIGPGGQGVHAAQRAILGNGATIRLVGLNLGVGLLWVGVTLDIGTLMTIGAGGVLISLVGAISLSIIAMAAGRPSTATSSTVPGRTAY